RTKSETPSAASNAAFSTGTPSVFLPSARAMRASLSGFRFASIRIASDRVRHDVMPWGIFQVAPITRPIEWLNPVPTLTTPAHDIQAASWQFNLDGMFAGFSVETRRFWKSRRIASSASVSTYGWWFAEYTASTAWSRPLIPLEAQSQSGVGMVNS